MPRDQASAAMPLWTLGMVVLAVCVAIAASLIPWWPRKPADPAMVVAALEASWPAWLQRPDQCPADLLPGQQGPQQFSIDTCAADVERCLARCQTGDAGHCYAAALVLQNVRKTVVSQALFQRACASGLVSGCTNRAAEMDSGPGQACAIRTYGLACERDDPWACTMMGFHLLRGIGIDKDPERARKALAKSCRFGDQDDACRFAKGLLKEVGG
jgi:hypothetical protein